MRRANTTPFIGCTLDDAGKAATWALLHIAITTIQELGDWRAVMLNKVVEVDAAGAAGIHPLPDR